MKILVRDFDNDKWKVAKFNQYNKCSIFPYKANNINYIQAMCYDADYLGTTKKPPRELILKDEEKRKLFKKKKERLMKRIKKTKSEIKKINERLK